MAHGYSVGIKPVTTPQTPVIVQNPLIAKLPSHSSTPMQSNSQVERNKRRISLCERLTETLWSKLGYASPSEAKDVEGAEITEVFEHPSTPPPHHKRISELSSPRGSLSADSADESKSQGIEDESSPSSVRTSRASLERLDIIKAEFHRFTNLVREFHRLEIELLNREEALKSAPSASMTGLEMVARSPASSRRRGSSEDIEAKSDEEVRVFKDYQLMSLEELNSAHKKAIAEILQSESALRQTMNKVFVPHLTSCGTRQCFRTGPAKLGKKEIEELSKMSRVMLYEMEQLQADARFRRRPSIANAIILAMYSGLRIGGGLMVMYLLTYNRYTFTDAYPREMHYTPEKANEIGSQLQAYIAIGAISLFFLTTITGVLEQIARRSIKFHSKLGDLVGINGPGLFLTALLQVWFKDVGWPYYAGIAGAIISGVLMASFTKTELNAARREYSEYLPYPTNKLSKIISVSSAANSGAELPFICEIIGSFITLTPYGLPFTTNLLLSLSVAAILGCIGANRHKLPLAYHMANTILKALHHAGYAPLTCVSAFGTSKFQNSESFARAVATISYSVSLIISLYALYRHGDTLTTTNAARSPILDRASSGAYTGPSEVSLSVKRTLDFSLETSQKGSNATPHLE